MTNRVYLKGDATIENELKRLIEENKVVPFVGAGVSMSVVDNNGKQIFPSWANLLQILAKKLDNDKEEYILSALKVKKDYLSIADDIKEFFSSKRLYHDVLKDIFDIEREQIQDDSLALARAVWELDQRLVITTNYDKVLNWASPKPVDTKYWDIQAKYEQVSSLRDGVTKDTVWHIHGHIDNIDKIILTTDGYNRLYGNSADAEFKTALGTLQSYLAQKSFLFVGYSMDDRFFVDELIKVCDTFGDSHSEHYILLHKDRELHSSLDKKVIPIYFDDYGQPLINKLKSLKPNRDKINLNKIVKLIQALGGDSEEFLSAYFGKEYQKILQNEATYNNLKLKLQTTDSSLDRLLEEKKSLEEKIASYSLNQATQKQIDKAFQELQFEQVREIIDGYLKSTQHIQEDRYKAHYQKALSYLEQIRYTEAKEEIEYIPAQKIEDAQMSNDYARIYKLCGEYSSALPLYLKALKIKEKLLGEEHPDTATSYNDLAGHYVLMGEYEKAEPLSLKALKIQEKLLGEEHPYTATSYNNLAILYYNTEKYQKAYNSMKRAIEILEKVLPPEHPHLIKARDSLRVIEQKLS